MEQTFSDSDLPIHVPLSSGFKPGHSVTIWGCVHSNAKRFAIDLVRCEENGNCDIVYHFNPRFEEECVIQNSRTNLIWDREERSRTMPFEMGELFELKIICTSLHFVVSVNNKKFTEFLIKKDSNDFISSFPNITHLYCQGDINVKKVLYTSNELILEPYSMYWQQIRGHLKKVETVEGITWGIGFDNTAWLYLGNYRLLKKKKVW